MWFLPQLYKKPFEDVVPLILVLPFLVTRFLFCEDGKKRSNHGNTEDADVEWRNYKIECQFSHYGGPLF